MLKNRYALREMLLYYSVLFPSNSLWIYCQNSVGVCHLFSVSSHRYSFFSSFLTLPLCHRLRSRMCVYVCLFVRCYIVEMYSRDSIFRHSISPHISLNRPITRTLNVMFVISPQKCAIHTANSSISLHFHPIIFALSE